MHNLGRPEASHTSHLPYGRFAIFIDGSNFYHTLRDLHLQVDYKRLLAYFGGQGQLVRTTYYTALLDGQTPDWLIRLTDWLAYNGVRVVTKPAKVFRNQFQDEAGVRHWTSEVKSNMDIEMAVDILTLAPHLDTVILCSGKGDLTSLVAAVQRQGVRVLVVSSERSGESTVADELRRQADGFIELIGIAEHIRMVRRAEKNGDLGV